MGPLEILLVVLIGLAVLGPERLPEIARKLGRVVRTINRMGAEFSRTLDDENPAGEGKKVLGELKKAGQDVAQTLSEATRKPQEELRQAGEELNRAVAGDTPRKPQ